MAEIIRMPRMSDTMEEGNIVSWLKKVGESVEPGDLLAEVETDKATMELESYHEGVLLHIGVEQGPVQVNGIIAVIGEKGEDFQAQLEAEKANSGTKAPEENGSDDNTKTPPTMDMSHSMNDATEETPISTMMKAEDSRIKASPLAKSLAKEKGIDLLNVTGSGDGGRIIKKDIESYKAPAEMPVVAATPTKPAKAPNPNAMAFRPFTGSSESASDQDIPLSQMRKVIARRLGESKFQAPHFYLTIEVDMDRVIEARKSLNEIAPTKISFNDLVVKACAFALQYHPEINASWLGDKIRRNANINIGVAVAVDEGLLVPVIKNANLKSLSQINAEVRELAGKARSKKIQPNEMQGNTFTISNLGMFNIEEFTAIINPPDACILAVGTIVKKPVVKNGEIVIGNKMKMTLSCDHRVVDGATGAKFMKTLQNAMEDPVRLLV